MITMTEKEYVNKLVFTVCSEDPSCVPGIIETATLGVKAFAEKQSEETSQLRSILLDLIDSNDLDSLVLRYFTRDQILSQVAAMYAGTVGFEKLARQYKYKLRDI